MGETLNLHFKAAMCGVFLVMSLRYADFYPAIVLSLMGFGFCGLGSFPIVLELAVEVGRKCIFIKNQPTTIIQWLDLVKNIQLEHLSLGIVSKRSCDI